MTSLYHMVRYVKMYEIQAKCYKHDEVNRHRITENYLIKEGRKKYGRTVI